jgi:hypothetical protein
VIDDGASHVVLTSSDGSGSAAPALAERDAAEGLLGANGLDGDAGGDVPVAGEVEEGGPDLGGAEQLG